MVFTRDHFYVLFVYLETPQRSRKDLRSTFHEIRKTLHTYVVMIDFIFCRRLFQPPGKPSYYKLGLSVRISGQLFGRQVILARYIHGKLTSNVLFVGCICRRIYEFDLNLKITSVRHKPSFTMLL